MNNLFRKVLCIVIILTSTVFGYSKTLHVITFCDTNDPKIGRMASNSCNMFRDKLMDISYRLGYEYYFEEFDNNGFKKDTLEKVLKSLNSSFDDIIVFYYFGHGLRTVDQQNQFPQMCFGTNDQSDFVPIQYVINMLHRQAAHLKLAISNCDNIIAVGVTPKDIISDATMASCSGRLSSSIDDEIIAEKDSTNFGSEDIEPYKKLFDDFVGILAITSSRPGQHSWGNTQNGSIFDVVFWDVMETVFNNELPAEWGGIFKVIQEKTDGTVFNNTTPPAHQKPYFEIIENQNFYKTND